MDFTRSELEQLGFEGFIAVSCLKERCGCNVIPKEMGVYVVCRNKTADPTFLSTPGGYGPEELQSNWVDGAYVMNIGKAGGAGLKTGLKRRVGAYIRFGIRGKGGHQGGRAIWQLSDADDLLVAWRLLCSTEPIDEEQWLLDRFRVRYGRYPFANMRR